MQLIKCMTQLLMFWHYEGLIGSKKYHSLSAYHFAYVSILQQITMIRNAIASSSIARLKLSVFSLQLIISNKDEKFCSLCYF